MEERLIERGPVTEDEVIHAFLLAEINSNRWGRSVEAALTSQNIERSLIDAPLLGNPDDSRRRKRVLASLRNYDRPVDVFERIPADSLRRVDLQLVDFENIE